MLLNPFTFYAPKTLTEALDLYSSLQNARIQAGGTFLLNALKMIKRKGSKSPEHVISLRKVAELKGMHADANQLTIGSMTTIDEIFDSPLLEDNFSVFKIVCRNISTQPIRNMATIGGNLTCRYTWTEMPAAIMGLEGRLHFKGKNGQEEILNAEDFYKNAAKTDKILTHVSIARDKKASITYRRVKKTQYVDVPLLSLLIKAHFNGDRFTNTVVSVNNCVNFAQRDRTLEAFLNQSRCSPKLGEEALAHCDQPIYETRSSDYKKHMFRVSLKSAIEELMEQQKCR